MDNLKPSAGTTCDNFQVLHLSFTIFATPSLRTLHLQCQEIVRRVGINFEIQCMLQLCDFVKSQTITHRRSRTTSRKLIGGDATTFLKCTVLESICKLRAFQLQKVLRCIRKENVCTYVCTSMEIFGWLRMSLFVFYFLFTVQYDLEFVLRQH